MNKYLLFVILLIGLGDTTYGTFTCQQGGAFPDPDATDCSTFIYCYPNLEPSVMYCPYNTFFWPLHQACFSYYDCSNDVMPNGDDVNPCEGFAGNTIVDRYSTNAASFIQCTQYSYDGVNIIVHGERYECYGDSIFRPKQGCVNWDCPSAGCGFDYQCTEEGNFANPDTNDCSTFIKCNKHTSSSSSASYLYATLIDCPANTKFSPYSKKCDEFYTCGGSDPHNGVDPCATFNWANPVAPNPHANDCKTYLQCQIEASEAIDVIIKKDCPPDTFFSPNIGKCYYNYDCNQICSKDPCGNGAGKFVDLKSGYCQGFIECRDDSKNALTYRPTYEQRYCPPGALFSPDIADCDRNYVCPKFPVDYCYPIIPTTEPPSTTSTTTTSAPIGR